MGLVPAAKDMIQVLSNIYTQTARAVVSLAFFHRAIATLYGTIFASTAANSRVFADMVRLMGFFQPGDYAARLRYRKWFVVILTTIPLFLILFVHSPVKMVIAGGMAQSIMLPVIGVGTLYVRHKRLPANVKPSLFTTISLWFCSAIMVVIVGYGVLQMKW